MLFSFPFPSDFFLVNFPKAKYYFLKKTEILLWLQDLEIWSLKETPSNTTKLMLSLRNSKVESKGVSRTCSSDYTQALSPFEELPHISQVQAEQVVWDIPEQGPSNRNICLGQRRRCCCLSFKWYLMLIPIPCTSSVDI